MADTRLYKLPNSLTNYVTFKEADHSYTSKAGETYISATTLIGLYKPYFDTNYMTLRTAAKDLLTEQGHKSAWYTLLNKTVAAHGESEATLATAIKESTKISPYYSDILLRQQQLRMQWKEKNRASQIKGTEYHLLREQQAYTEDVQRMTGTDTVGSLVQSYSFNLRDLQDGYHAELLLYNHDYMVSGQADRVWITTEAVTLAAVTPENLHRIWWIEGIPHVRYVDIDDFKTNAKIKEAYGNQKMLEPLAHLPNGTESHYSLQISLYAWMLEQVGYTVRHTRFTHVKTLKNLFTNLDILHPVTKQPYYEETPYIFPYKKHDVERMLNHYRTHGNTRSKH